MAFITVIHRRKMAQAKVSQVVLRCPLLKQQGRWADGHIGTVCWVSMTAERFGSSSWTHISLPTAGEGSSARAVGVCQQGTFLIHLLLRGRDAETIFLQIITIILRSNRVNQLIINSEGSPGGWQGSLLASSPEQLLTSEGNNSQRCDALDETSQSTPTPAFTKP